MSWAAWVNPAPGEYNSTQSPDVSRPCSAAIARFKALLAAMRWRVAREVVLMGQHPVGGNA